jgi:hypothetical protein
MDIAALIFWIITAGGGFYLLATWLAKGGARPQPAGSGSNFPPALIFSHFALAAAGLIVWIIYVANDKQALAWAAFVVLVVVALLGFTMFARWIPVYQSRRAGTAQAVGVGAAPTEPAERHFPVPVVLLHGLLAATTLVLVLLSALEVGGS